MSIWMLTADRIYPVKSDPPLRTSSSTDGWTIYEWWGTRYWDYPRSPSLCWVLIQIDNTCDEKTSERSEKTSQVDADLFMPGTCVLLILLIFLNTFETFGSKHFILIFVGHATGTGRLIAIPVIIKTLAEKMLSDKKKNEFLSYILGLDIDCGEKRIQKELIASIGGTKVL